jgi:hypothetical protein
MRRADRLAPRPQRPVPDQVGGGRLRRRGAHHAGVDRQAGAGVQLCAGGYRRAFRGERRGGRPSGPEHHDAPRAFRPALPPGDERGGERRYRLHGAVRPDGDPRLRAARYGGRRRPLPRRGAPTARAGETPPRRSAWPIPSWRRTRTTCSATSSGGPSRGWQGTPGSSTAPTPGSSRPGRRRSRPRVPSTATTGRCSTSFTPPRLPRGRDGKTQ